MTDPTPHLSFPEPAALDALWQDFEDALTAYLETMTDPSEQDHLIVELPDLLHCPGTTPYAQFAAMDGGRMLRAEITGNHHLDPIYQLGIESDTILRSLRWQGNDDASPNWFTERPITDAPALAIEATTALRHLFGIVHPELLTQQAWGPASAGIGLLGLAATEDVPTDGQGVKTSLLLEDELGEPSIESPSDREELAALVGMLLEERFEEPVSTDEDEDFVLHRHGQPLWVRVSADEPVVQVFACVARGVRSRRTAAVEVGLLNRDHRWMKWILAERDVWQTLSLPGRPFVPIHFAVLLDAFIETLGETRDDLMYRTGTRTA